LNCNRAETPHGLPPAREWKSGSDPDFHTPGFVADASLAAQMAEIGVILLMFSAGMHFHPQELLRAFHAGL
jgi:Kef-type K+ transport system membrane component KefB